MKEYTKQVFTNGQTLTADNLNIIEDGIISKQSKLNDVKVDFKADVYMIPCYGQSLSINTSAGASTFTSIEPLSYNTSLQNNNIQDMCAGTAEAFRLMAEYYGITLPEKFKIISSADGAGGISVARLSKGTGNYNKLINSVKTAKASCDKAGLTMCVPCFTWTQGEEDMRAGGNPNNYGTDSFDPFTYKNRLRQLIDDLNTDIKAITGQTNDVLCISYQVASHNAYQRYPRIALQQQELAEEYDKMILAKTMYDIEYGDQVHAPAKCYRNMGNLYGIAAFNTCVLNQRNRWCYPISHTIKNNKVNIRFDVPFKPLALDTKLINQLPDGNYGFNVYNVDEESGAAGTISEAETRITNVRLRGDDEVEITLNRAPVQGERLTYGINGDFWQNIAGSAVINTGGESPNGGYKSGWQYGSRGCLRDSSPLKNPNNPDARLQNLYNWCTIFEICF